MGYLRTALGGTTLVSNDAQWGIQSSYPTEELVVDTRTGKQYRWLPTGQYRTRRAGSPCGPSSSTNTVPCMAFTEIKPGDPGYDPSWSPSGIAQYQASQPAPPLTLPPAPGPAPDVTTTVPGLAGSMGLIGVVLLAGGVGLWIWKRSKRKG